jgi:hypothetical protein
MTGDGSFSSIKPTLKLSKPMREAVENGTVRLRRGQWVEDECGWAGRFLGLRNGIAYFSWFHEGQETPESYTHRFLRALRQHSKLAYYRHQLNLNLTSYLVTAFVVLFLLLHFLAFAPHQR